MRPLERPSKPYTRQEVFDRVWQHFVVEKNPRAVRSNDTLCTYEGTGCAIGCCITLEDSHKFEAQLGPYQHCQALTGMYFNYEDESFLQALQRVHDWQCAADNDFQKHLTIFANENELRIPHSVS